MHAFLNTAVKAALDAGNIIARAYLQDQPLKIDTKSKNDFVTQVDRAAEKSIIETLSTAYPEHAILSEESGFIPNESGAETPEQARFLWIIDPLDGTSNFIHRLPQFSVSIALRYNQKLEHGVVYHPLTQDLYTASRGRGVRLNNKRLRINPNSSINGMLFSAGIPRPLELKNHFDKIIQYQKEHDCNLRRSGSSALDLAYVGAGHLHAFYALGAKSWDVAAGALIIREAGGLVIDLHGGEDFLFGGSILAGAPHIVKSILPAIKLEN